MKTLRILLIWALLLGPAPLILGQHAPSQASREKSADTREKGLEEDASGQEAPGLDGEDEEDGDFRRPGAKANLDGRAPDPGNRSRDMVATDLPGSQAVTASEDFAENFGITNPSDRKELLKACLKYYRAKELLEAEFADKNNGQYLRKGQILEREFSREISRLLPQG